MTELLDLPPVTIVIEWENALDVTDEWSDRAVAALERELAAVAGRMRGRPTVTYLHDPRRVDAAAIRRVIDCRAPRLAALARLEIPPVPGLSYYELKNVGVARARTELSILLDSDAAPQPGWLAAMVDPFADPEVMAVGGITVLGYRDLLSKTLALTWIFNLFDERERTARSYGVYANNTAVRTAFFRAHPFPKLDAFKKQCGFWLADITARGFRYVRVADAVTVHAPHPGYRFTLWRAWATGRDRDFADYHRRSHSRLRRIGYAFCYFARRLWRGWSKIIRKGRNVDLPVWQRPAAMAITLGFFLVALIAQITTALARRYGPLPEADVAPQEVAQG